MSHSTIRKIQSYYSRLSTTDQAIADFMIEKHEYVVHMTISEVAERIQIADATVFRFCKRIGFNGFQDLKISLAKEKKAPDEMYDEITDSDDDLTIAHKVFKANIETLENTASLLSQHSIEEAMTAIKEAKGLYFFGVGGSATIAMDGYHKFMRTGTPSYAFIDSHFQLMAASQLSKKDVAIIISHSGSNKDTLQILNTANEAGATTIAITSFPKSIIASKAKIVLLTSSKETEYRSEALSSRIAQLSIIDALFVNLMVHSHEKGQKVLSKIRNAISQTRQ
jgi:RpiR family transcriptional regulator, carbohydrate utilization regulator